MPGVFRLSRAPYHRPRRTDRRRMLYGVTSDALAVTTPAAYTVRQRTGDTNGVGGTGTIACSGTHAGGTSIEATYDGGSNWVVVDASPGAGTWAGTITGVPAGQYTVTFRLGNNTGVTRSVNYVGVGDVFVVAGQSNAAGFLASNQSYASATGLVACLFKNSYAWAELTDPTDDATGQVDTVSSDPSSAGSVWPLLATHLMAYCRCPVAFVPTASGGTQVADWLPGADHLDRTTRYGSMNYRTQNSGAGGLRAVLWWQGESDAVAGTSQATYHSRLSTLVAAVQADLGVPVLACKFQDCDITQANQDAVNAAIGQAWGDVSGCEAGPDLSDIQTMPADQYHLRSNAQGAVAASRWWVAVYEALYDAASGGGGSGVAGLINGGLISA